MIRKRVNQIYAQKKLLDKEIEDLRSKCKHEKSIMSYFSWRPGALSVKMICTECDDITRNCTDEETREFMKNN